MPPLLILLLPVSMILMFSPATAGATAEPWNGPPRMPYEATTTQPGFHLDEFENFRINTDNSGEFQNDKMVYVNPVFHDEVVAIWSEQQGHQSAGLHQIKLFLAK